MSLTMATHRVLCAVCEYYLEGRQTPKLMALNKSGSGRSCDQPTRSSFSVVFLGHIANTVLIPKFHVALHASQWQHQSFALMSPSQRYYQN